MLKSKKNEKEFNGYCESYDVRGEQSELVYGSQIYYYYYYFSIFLIIPQNTMVVH